jgi:hypothetical protein
VTLFVKDTNKQEVKETNKEVKENRINKKRRKAKTSDTGWML